MTRKLRVVMTALAVAFVAVALLMGVGRLLASTLASDSVPEVVNYQGHLTDSGGVPISGSVTLQFSIWDTSSGGTQLWSETHNNVTVSGGYFSVLLGSQGTPLTSSVFDGPSRYLEVIYNGTTFARQKFASVPYALVAEQARQAQEASTAITSTYATTATNAATASYATTAATASTAVTASYATTATYALNGPEGVDWSHVVVVAKSGGDYTTVGDAMSAISPSTTDRYLVLVMPGIYEEQVTLKSFVHLKGAGVDATLITSAANTTNFNDNAAATLLMPADSQISDLKVQNSSTSNDAVALKILSGNVDTILDNVAIQTIALGGVRHIGLYINTGSPRLNNVDVQVKGGTTFNRGINSVAATPVIRNTAVLANGTQPSGLHISGNGPVVLESVINATNGTNGNGITTNGPGTNVYIDRSSIGGDTGASGHSIFSTDNVNFFVGASLMKGSVLAFDFNHITCSRAYDENYSDLNADCN